MSLFVMGWEFVGFQTYVFRGILKGIFIFTNKQQLGIFLSNHTEILETFVDEGIIHYWFIFISEVKNGEVYL